MTDYPKTDSLFNQIAEQLGVEELTPDENGGVRFNVGDDEIILFPQDEDDVLLVLPVAEIPRDADFGTMLWLLKKNLYDSELDMFRLASDGIGNLILWGRIPLDSLTGENSIGLMGALAEEASTIRSELGIDEQEDE